MGRVSMVDGHIDGSNTCVICGKDIPEGSQVCVICGYDVRKEKPKFMERIQLSAPKIADMGELKTGMEINTLIQPVKNLDDAICVEIVKMAEEKGINNLWLLNKNAIVSALEKQIPKKPIILGYREGREINTISYTCPMCHKHTSKENYCKHCGQALDWSDTE